MRPLFLAAAFAALMTGCSPPASQGPNAPAPPPLVEACNALAPDTARLVTLEGEVAVAAAVADLRGGRVTPGRYDLVSGNRIGGAVGWQGGRAVALDVSESGAGTIFNWAASAPVGGEEERWTAGFIDAPLGHLTYTCGRSGGADVEFTAEANALRMRLPEQSGAGSLFLVFARQS